MLENVGDMPVFLKEILKEEDFTEEKIKNSAIYRNLDMSKKDILKDEIVNLKEKFNQSFNKINGNTTLQIFLDYQESMNWILDNLIISIDEANMEKVAALRLIGNKLKEEVDNLVIRLISSYNK